ncbi:hypothetical protein Tco_1168799, partial [Tanacetum coccineum]
PVPLPEDPYEAIRQAYLNGTDIESEPFEDLIDTEILESPLAIAPPISLFESIPPVLIPILCRTTGMVVRVPHAMSSGLSASMAEVAAMSEFALRKRFWSSYKSSPSVSPPDLPSRKRYREDEDPATEDEGLTMGIEGPGMHDEGYGLDDKRHGRDDESHGIDEEGHSVESDGLSLEEEEEAALGSQQQVAPVVGTVASMPLGLGYRALRHRELALEEGDEYSTFKPTLTTWTDPEDGMIYIDISDYPPPAPLVQTPPSPEWTSGSLPISPSHSNVPSPILSPMIPLTVPSPVATPAAVETEGFLTKLGAQVEMHGGLIRDHAVRLEELLPALFERYDRDIGELLTRSGALEAWAGQTDAQRVALWHAISDVQGEN